MRKFSACLLLLFFSAIDAGKIGWQRSDDMMHVLISMPAGKWCNNGVAGYYNTKDLPYAREVATNCKADNINSLLGFCRVHCLFAIGYDDEFFTRIQLSKKKHKK